MDKEQLIHMYQGAMQEAMSATAEKRSFSEAMLGTNNEANKRAKESEPDAQEVLRQVTERMATRAWEQPK